ncbi:MAG: hypothetical protein SNJ61_12175, partial [Fimbriimonadaceae bacterium]
PRPRAGQGERGGQGEEDDGEVGRGEVVRGKSTRPKTAGLRKAGAKTAGRKTFRAEDIGGRHAHSETVGAAKATRRRRRRVAPAGADRMWADRMWADRIWADRICGAAGGAKARYHHRYVRRQVTIT